MRRMHRIHTTRVIVVAQSHTDTWAHSHVHSHITHITHIHVLGVAVSLAPVPALRVGLRVEEGVSLNSVHN